MFQIQSLVFNKKSSTAWQADASEATLQGGRILVFNIRPLLCTVLCNNNGKVEVLLERISKWPSQSIFPINLPCQNCDLLDISKYYIRGNLLLMALLEDVCLFGMREMEALVRFPSLALVVHEEIGKVEWKGERYLKRRITITMHFLVRIESKSEGEFLMLIQLNPWASAASYIHFCLTLK